MGSLSQNNIVASGRPNRIVNGNFLVDQVNEFVTPYALNANGTVPICDGWKVILANVTTLNTRCLPRASPISIIQKFQNALSFDGTGAGAVDANASIKLRQIIEGNMLDCFYPNAANTTNYGTLTFTLLANITIPCILPITFISSSAGNPIYATSITVSPGANVYSVTIPMNGLGGWNLAFGVSGLTIDFWLNANAADIINIANTNKWIASAAQCAPNGANFINSIANGLALFVITGISFTPGGFLPSSDYRSVDQELLLCQRYYEKSFPQFSAPAQNTGSSLGASGYYVSNAAVSKGGLRVPYRTPKCKLPAITTYNPNAANANWRNITLAADSGVPVIDVNDQNGFTINNPQVIGDALGNLNVIHWVSDARL